jgi:hypothetical protein
MLLVCLRRRFHPADSKQPRCTALGRDTEMVNKKRILLLGSQELSSGMATTVFGHNWLDRRQLEVFVTFLIFFQADADIIHFPAKPYWLRDAPTGLRFKNCTFSPHCIYVFCIYLRKNRDLCIVWYILTGFYIRGGKCSLRGTKRVLSKTVYPSSIKG